MEFRKVSVAILLAMIIVLVVGIVYVAHDLATRKQNGAAPMITPSPIITGPPSPVPTATPTATPSPTPTSTPSPTQPSTGPISVVSVVLLQPYNPGGPTIEITLENAGNNSVTSLQAVLTLSGNTYTYTFSEVSKSNPLLPDQETSQTQTLLNAGFEQNQPYPLEIIGYQQNGTKIDYTTQVTISSAAS